MPTRQLHGHADSCSCHAAFPTSFPLKAPTECALSTALFPSSPGIGATLGILAAPHTPTSSSH